MTLCWLYEWWKKMRVDDDSDDGRYWWWWQWWRQMLTVVTVMTLHSNSVHLGTPLEDNPAFNHPIYTPVYPKGWESLLDNRDSIRHKMNNKNWQYYQNFIFARKTRRKTVAKKIKQTKTWEEIKMWGKKTNIHPSKNSTRIEVNEGNEKYLCIRT